MSIHMPQFLQANHADFTVLCPLVGLCRFVAERKAGHGIDAGTSYGFALADLVLVGTD